MILLIILFAIIFIIIVFIITIYNLLIYSRNRVKQSLANIDVLLKQRNDEIGNLVNVVKGYSAFERETLESIVKLRTSYSPSMGVYGKDVYNKRINAGMKQLFAVVENYPNIKADKQYLRLQQRITQLENQIADRREYYNWTVTNFNTRIEQFPYSIIGNIFKFEKKILFKYS